MWLSEFQIIHLKMAMIRCQSPGWYHDDPDILAISLRVSHKPLILHLPPSMLPLLLSYCFCECLHHPPSCAFQKRGSPCNSSPTLTPSQPARVLNVSPVQTPLCTSIPGKPITVCWAPPFALVPLPSAPHLLAASKLDYVLFLLKTLQQLPLSLRTKPAHPPGHGPQTLPDPPLPTCPDTPSPAFFLLPHKFPPSFSTHQGVGPQLPPAWNALPRSLHTAPSSSSIQLRDETPPKEALPDYPVSGSLEPSPPPHSLSFSCTTCHNLQLYIYVFVYLFIICPPPTKAVSFTREGARAALLSPVYPESGPS